MSTNAKSYVFARNLPPLSIGGTKVKDPDHVHLSFGFPSSDLLPVEELNQAAAEALQFDRIDALHYSGAEGPNRIRNWVLDRIHKFSVYAEESNYLATFGATQGIDLSARVLLNPGDEVWVEAPTFFSALQSFRIAGAKIVSFPLDEHGLRVDLLEAALLEVKHSNRPLPKFVYCMPNFHNPSGVSMAIDRRKKLAELAADYNFFILEDDAYAELHFSPEVRPSIYSFAPEQVIYISTFSKTLGPGLRMGWVIAVPEVINHMRTLALGSQLNPFSQEIVGQLLTHFPFEEHVSRLQNRYKEHRDAMVHALRDHFGDLVHFPVPEGGFFMWLTFGGENTDVNRFAQLAVERGVSFVAGNPFFPDGNGSRHARLCFSYCDKARIQRGIRILAESFSEYRSSSTLR